MSTPRIAVLLTNADDSAFAKAYPNDGQKVIELLRPQRPNWAFEVVMAKDNQWPQAPQSFDAYVITGSPASVNDEGLPWLAPLLDWIRRLHAARLPTVGLCFGHQAIAKALGGHVAPHLGGWGLGLGDTHWHSPAPWMQPLQAHTRLMAAHNEQVVQMPAEAACMGSSSFCPVAAMRIGEHVFTTQFHPEMSRTFMNDLLDFLRPQLSPEVWARAQHSLQASDDAPLFAQWMLQFMEHAWEQQR